MDLGSNKNAFMLFRMIKVFRQPSEILREIEKQMMMNNSSTVIRSNNSSFAENTMQSSPRSPNSFNRSGGSHHRSHNQSAIEDSNYIYLFSEDVRMQIYTLMQRLYAAKLKTNQDVQKMEKELNKQISMWEKCMQIIGWFSSLSLSFTMALEEKKKTPIYLEFCLNILSPAFGIPIEDVTSKFERHEGLLDDSDEDHVMSGSEFLNITPSFMKQQLQNVSYTGDPFLLPIGSHEVRFLVRFLHQISCKLNEMVRYFKKMLYSQ